VRWRECRGHERGEHLTAGLGCGNGLAEWEERSLPQLRDAQLHIARLGGQQPLTSQQCSSPNSSGNDSTKTSPASAPC
jgi:hypothetical protein